MKKLLAFRNKMKIRTTEELYNKLSEDLSWRKKELTLFKSRIDTADEKRLNSEIRAGIVMLYSHWEGFIKNATSYYLIYVKQLKLNYSDLAPCLLTLSLKSKLLEFNNNYNHEENLKFVDFFQNNLNQRAFWNLEKAVDTKSNLNSEVLQNILSVVGISFHDFELKSNLIDEKLVKNRNTIAHGNYLSFTKNDYKNLHAEIVGMVNNIFNQITNLAVLKKYKNSA
ncbi:MAE_28990/MAE_18760 family HEPN-like nuclease [Hyunsoonleella rubra]|uniref:MAE_28990/MAE_18760 family HEPN-like nuclease n=1 Tax=Hyunsoonleella rubra TaxID=1737062 RepID=A0ABW5T5T0_9FLAO